MKIQYTLINDNNEVIFSSVAEHIKDGKDAGIFVQETIESNPNLTHCSGCEVLVEGKTGDTVYCKKCRNFIPDDSDFSSAVDEI